MKMKDVNGKSIIELNNDFDIILDYMNNDNIIYFSIVDLLTKKEIFKTIFFAVFPNKYFDLIEKKEKIITEILSNYRNKLSDFDKQGILKELYKLIVFPNDSYESKLKEKTEELLKIIDLLNDGIFTDKETVNKIINNLIDNLNDIKGDD